MRHAFLDHHSVIDSPIHHLDARVKILVFFTFILVGVSSPPTSFILFGLQAMILISIALFARLPLGHLAKKVLIILPFLFVVTISIPFMNKDLPPYQSGFWILWNVVVKSSLGVFSIILLSSTTSFPQLVKGMEKLGFPKIFTMLTSFMYRYSFIIIDEIYKMKRARDSRSFGGKWLWQSTVIGHMVGTLFLRSFHRGERVYLAMLSRGYNGTMPETTTRKVGLGEILFLSISPILIFLRIYLR